MLECLKVIEPGNACIEINTLEQGVDLDVGLGTGGQSSLSALTGCAQTSDGTLVAGAVLFVLALKLLDEMVHHPEFIRKYTIYKTIGKKKIC